MGGFDVNDWSYRGRTPLAHRVAGVDAKVSDKLKERERGEYKSVSPKDDPRLERDHTINAQPVLTKRKQHWLKTRRRKRLDP